MKGVLLVNMGGPESPEELKIFLSRMFRDPAILPYGKVTRYFLSFVISRSRYKKSWKKYQLIGGTPLVASTIQTVEALQGALGESFSVRHAFSYSNPNIGKTLTDFRKDGIGDVTVIPLYPQSSQTTTSSVTRELGNFIAGDPFFKITVVEEFYRHPGFVAFWTSQIKKHIAENVITEPTLVFSAHSIPEYRVVLGDTYPTGIVNSAALIAEEMGYHYEAAFQSGMKRGAWIGPDLREHLKILAEEQIDNLIVIPISFVHENLETLYDLDLDIIPFAKDSLGIKHISRVKLPQADPLFVSLLVDLVQKK